MYCQKARESGRTALLLFHKLCLSRAHGEGGEKCKNEHTKVAKSVKNDNNIDLDVLDVLLLVHNNNTRM